MFVSSGEKVEDLEAFHPDRMANRILGMGDVVSLVEQAEEKLDMEIQKQTAKNLMSGTFNFNDLLNQYDEITKMGSMQKMLKMIPGMNKMAQNVDDELMNKNLKKSRAIIQSMTPYERENPGCLKASRKNRIAKGAGVKVMEINKLINQIEQMQMVSKMMKNGVPNMNALQNMQRGGGMQGMSKHSGSKKTKKSKKKKKK